MNINDKKIKWMKIAFREAEKAFESEEIPIGAVIVKGGKVIGKGYNQMETLKDATAHAEMIAITSAASTLGDWRLSDCTLYVTKEPCLMCAGAIINSRIKQIVFGAYDDKKGGLDSLSFAFKKNNFFLPEIYGGIHEKESLILLKKFFKSKRR